MSVVIPRERRPDQNTGLRAPKAREVEEQPCPGRDGGLHLLTNREAVTYCVGCKATWPALDAELNRRAG